jgi:spore maturation protein CgeB
MQKVLIIGPNFFGYNESIADAFKNLGWETNVLSYQIGETKGLMQKLVHFFAKDKEAFFEKRKVEFNTLILKTYKAFNPNLVFIIQGNSVFNETLQQMHHCKKILWMMDSIFRAAGAMKIIHSVDNIFLFEKSDIAPLKTEKGIEAHFLPLAVDEKIYYNSNNTKEIDVLFIGALYENRMNVLKKIAAAIPTLKLRVYGRFYSPLRKPLYHLLRKDKAVFTNKNVTPAEANQLYNKSKICLNIHHSQSKYGVNQRFFEVNGSGNLQLVDENEYVQDYFPEMATLTFTDEVDLLQKINHIVSAYNSYDVLKNTICKKVLANHTFTKRIQEVLQTANI